MTIEKTVYDNTVALKAIAEAINRLVDHLVESPRGDLAEVVEHEVKPEIVQPEPVAAVDVTPEVIPVMPTPTPAPMTPPAPPTPVGVTKKMLWDELQATYGVLHAVQRGQEIGALLTQYKAAHLDQLDPKDYVSVHEALLSMKASAQEAGNG